MDSTRPTTPLRLHFDGKSQKNPRASALVPIYWIPIRRQPRDEFQLPTWLQIGRLSGSSLQQIPILIQPSDYGRPSYFAVLSSASLSARLAQLVISCCPQNGHRIGWDSAEALYCQSLFWAGRLTACRPLVRCGLKDKWKKTSSTGLRPEFLSCLPSRSPTARCRRLMALPRYHTRLTWIEPPGSSRDN